MLIAELIAEKNAKLEEARKGYYAGEPIMSDHEYDQGEAELKGLVKANPGYDAIATVLTTVGSDLPLFAEQTVMADEQTEDRLKGRIAHSVPMLSIENFYTIQDVCAWAESLGWPTLSVGSKLDGVSDSLVYESGLLTQALTRGDGSAGESVLRQILASGAVPASIPTYPPFGGRVEIRGEVVIPESKLQALNAENEVSGAKVYAASRNLAAGTLKLLDLDEVKRRGLQFRPWDILLPDGTMFDSGVERLKQVVAFGFSPSDDRIVTNREELIAAVEELLLTLQEPGAEIGKDGIVIKVDSHTLREKLGRGSKFPRFQICFKPQNQKADTEVLSVQWQVGRQGKVTPVATVAPVFLGGAKIEKATLNNLTWLQALGVRIGSKVALVRSGDVIPKVAEVLENGSGSTEIIPPATCPGCGMPTVTGADEDSEDSSVAILCKNAECPGRLRELLTYVADRTVLEIDGLGPELANKLVENRLVKDLAGLFQFSNELRSAIRATGQTAATQDILERGFPVALTLKMFESLETAKTAPWNRWLAAFSIPFIGRRLSKVIAKTLRLQPEDLLNLPAKFAAIKAGEIDGLGVSKLGELHRFANHPDSIKLCSALYNNGVRPAAIVSAAASGVFLAGVAFVITGEFEEFGSRDEITAKLETLGAVSKSSVSKNVTHLVVGAAPGKSKVTKAEQLGIQQVGYDWLKQALS